MTTLETKEDIVMQVLEDFSVTLHGLEKQDVEIPIEVDLIWRQITQILQEYYTRY